MKKITKKRLLVFLLLFITLSIVTVNQCYRMFHHNIHSKNDSTNYIYIYENTTWNELISIIEENNIIESKKSFLLHAKLLKFSQLKAGKYLIKAKEGNLNLIRRLRSGDKEATRITFNNMRTKEQLAARLGSQLMIDSLDIIERLQDDHFLKQYNKNKHTAVLLFIPNTYEVYWDISPEGLFERMHREYTTFWNTDRLEKAAALRLSPTEIAIVASIVEEETILVNEYPIVAGLYLNRLRIGMRLQADPTVKFACGDFGLRRILFKHLEVDSPYNTYKYAGLPPGPIRIPTAASIDAVLNHSQHKYLYMCAKETLNGEHNFATTLAEHNRNATRYQQELNKRNIR